MERNMATNDKSQKINVIADEVIAETKKKMEHPDEYRPIKTNLDELDKAIGGLVYPAYYVIGGKWKSCKTILAQHLATVLAASSHGRVDYFMLEEIKEQIGLRSLTRLTTSVTRNQFRDLNINAIDWMDITRARSALENVDLWVDDSVRSAAAIIKAARERGSKYVVVDYLQLLEDKYGHSESERLEYVSRLFIAARNTDKITFIVVYQLNEKGKAHGTRSVYRDADMAIEIKSVDDTVRTDKIDGVVSLVVLPSRIAPSGTGVINLAYSGAHSRISNIPKLNPEFDF
jgi:replicative DNA helicase